MGSAGHGSDIGAALDEGECEGHARATQRRRAQTNGATVELDNLLREREAYAGALVVLASVEALKDHENLLGVFGRNAYAVVGNVDAGKRSLGNSSHLHH